jgi:hypothetical protein
MTLGVLDLPAPLFAGLDQLMGTVLPPTGKLILWALLAAVVSMGLYWLLSPQGKLNDVKLRALKARQDLNAFDGEFQEAWPLMRSMLGLSMKQLGMTTMPAILASIPALALIVWLGTAYGYSLPSGVGQIEVETTPASDVSAAIETGANASPYNPPRLVVTDPGGEVLTDISLSAPIPTIHKKQWWNTLIGNPLGYLPADGDLDAIAFDLPENDYLGFGPSWLRPWYMLFFAVLVIGSLAIKFVGRIE